MTYNCLDRHVDNGLRDELAVIHDSPVSETTMKFTYGQIQHEVCIQVPARLAYNTNSYCSVHIFL